VAEKRASGDPGASSPRSGRPGLDEDVLTSEDVPDTKTLNREGLDEVALGERAYDRTRHAEVGE
jgi:hypothetical protein